MQPTEIDVLAIKPTNHEKYSPNLYKWLTARDHSDRRRCSFFRFDTPGMWTSGQIHIGYIYDGDFMGVPLNRVLGQGTKAQEMCYSLSRYDFVELPALWSEYVKDGRCAFDRAHQVNYWKADTRYTESGDTRICNWCGHVQKRRRWTVEVEREAWEAAEAQQQ